MHLTDQALATARATVPILCVDLVPVRGHDEVGLVLRDMPGRSTPVWCHLGGRVRRGETLRAALVRHLASTLQEATVQLPDDPQPQGVVQWFPTRTVVEPGLEHGYDPRQHAVALVYRVAVTGTPPVVAGGEGHAFRWWRYEELVHRDDLWPGALRTVRVAREAP